MGKTCTERINHNGARVLGKLSFMLVFKTMMGRQRWWWWDWVMK